MALATVLPTMLEQQAMAPRSRLPIPLLGIAGRKEVPPMMALIRAWMVLSRAQVSRSIPTRFAPVMPRMTLIAGLMVEFIPLAAVLALLRHAAAKPKEML